MSTNILFIGSINSMNNDVLGFSKPVNNGVCIVSSEKLLLETKPPYYGDTVNLKFWKSLNIAIGSYSKNVNHLISGYKYEYNHTKKTFCIYNISGEKILSKSNIKSIADMEIDFNIFKSHQLSILIESGDSDIVFLIPTETKVEDTGCLIDYKLDVIDNTIYGNKTPPYENFGYFCSEDVLNYNKEYLYSVKIIDRLNIINMYYYNNKFYSNTYNLYNYSSCLYPLVDKIDNKIDIIGISYMLPKLTTSLYPKLLPIVKDGETQNNRPLYENWLIYGKYLFKYNYIKYDSSDTLYLDVFDLSPNWG